MPKLYLVRRSLESFAGPMTLEEMKTAHQRMAFGLEDEVTGHCGPWVSFDDLPSTKKHYPEIARIVHEDMLSGWGLSEQSALRIVGEDTKKLKAARPRSLVLGLMFFMIATSALAAAVYMAGSSTFLGRSAPPEQGLPTVAGLADLLGRNDEQVFFDTMAGSRDKIVSKALGSREMFRLWIPYLRRFAFAGEGFIKGLPAKLLRGQHSKAAPVDCSRTSWRRRWQASADTWSTILEGKALARAHWARLVAWDPHWIRRRRPEGWQDPVNYYVGCLTMAKVALGDLIAEEEGLPGNVWSADQLREAKVIESRLHRQLDIAAGRRPEVVNDYGRGSNTGSKVLSLWDCFEAASESDQLNQCRLRYPMVSKKWQVYAEERWRWHQLRIATETLLEGQYVTSAGIAGCIAGLSGAGTTDYFTRFDYEPEQQLCQLATTPGLALQPLLLEVEGRYPGVKLAY